MTRSSGVSQSIMAVASVLSAVMLRLAAWPPLSGLMLVATNVLFPDRALVDHSWCAQTETSAIVAAKNRACCPGSRISKAAMKMLWR